MCTDTPTAASSPNFRQSLHFCRQRGHEIVRQHDEDDKTEAELVPVVVHVAPEGIPSAQGPVSTPTSPSAVAAQSGKLSKSPLLRLVALDHAALAASREALRAAVELGTIVFWFYVADRTTAMAAGPKQYMRDVFLFLFLVLTMVAGTYTMRPARAPVLAHRQQTEEWKGWMQVLFLLYHYYEAKEAYNAIRVFIASYVWMTGFGNFSYYHRSKDFSLGRFCQMLWRLNLLATLCCFALDNQYMLYYICPMHTLFTIMVYAALALWRRGNESAWGVWTKLAASLLLVVGVWEHKPVFYAIFRPFTFVLAYTDPRRPTPDALHEWYFRTGLDRYVWIHGMACAHLHPRLDAWLKKVDAEPPRKRRAIRSALAGASIVALVLWYKLVFRLPKLEYNVLHPYTSWIPITGYLVLRNLTPPLRLHSMGLYGWLGCITLETCEFAVNSVELVRLPTSFCFSILFHSFKRLGPVESRLVVFGMHRLLCAHSNFE
jgi:N-acetylneuraminate 9-O-acetyltransferase